MASFNLRDPKTQRLILTGFLGAGSLYVFFATPWVPINYPVAAEQIKVIKADFEKKSNDLARARQSVADLPRFQAEFAALHERYEMAAELLPGEKEMPGMLRRLTLAGQQCGVRFESFRPDPQVVKDHYTEIPIQITVVGGYHQVGQFLAEVANMPRIMKVSGLQILAYDKADESMTTEARFVVTAYTLNPASAQAKDPKADANATQTGTNPGGTNAATAK
jgi:type IV pilus assembly protein PilO